MKETLIKIGKILSVIALIITLIGAFTTGDVVFVITGIMSIPYIAWRLKTEFEPWNNTTNKE